MELAGLSKKETELFKSVPTIVVAATKVVVVMLQIITNN
jgi:hypothetical protein